MEPDEIVSRFESRNAEALQEGSRVARDRCIFAFNRQDLLSRCLMHAGRVACDEVGIPFDGVRVDLDFEAGRLVPKLCVPAVREPVDDAALGVAMREAFDEALAVQQEGFVALQRHADLFPFPHGMPAKDLRSVTVEEFRVWVGERYG